jgi:uncharacterized protein (DUF2141 family)
MIRRRFPNDLFRVQPAVSHRESRHRLLPLPEGEYVIGTHQDTNGNGDMDYTIFKIPKEPYGFSNMRGKIPGNYNKLKYKIDNQNRRIIIPLVMY